MSKLDKEALESLDSMRELMDNADCLISQEQVERALDRSKTPVACRPSLA